MTQTYTQDCTVRDFNYGITKLYYQLVRKAKGSPFSRIVDAYRELVDNAIKTGNTFHMNVLISLLLQTRDIVSGKGEYALFYNLLTVLDSHWGVIGDKLTKGLSLVFDAPSTNVKYDQQFDAPYGSWKDVKYILNHYKQFYKMDKRKFIKFIEQPGIINTIIQFVRRAYDLDEASSLLVRWLPRESSNKFGWQASIFAAVLFPSINIRDSLITYRKYCATGNKLLHTTQVLQCSGNWKDIDFASDVTRITMVRQKPAFLCQNKRCLEDEDRVACRDNFIKYYLQLTHNDFNYSLGLREIVGDIYECTNINLNNDDSVGEFMWQQTLASAGNVFQDTVVLLDNSHHMNLGSRPLYDAIWVALLMASKSVLGKQLLTFEASPRWRTLEDCNTLAAMVNAVHNTKYGAEINIYTAFEMIADACLHKDMLPDSVGKLVLTIITCDKINNNFLHNDMLQERLTRLFQETGMRSTHKRPYKTPALVFWNMQQNNAEFPSATSTTNAVVMTGYNDDILSSVVKEGILSLKEITPWSTLSTILLQERYTWFW